MDRKSDIIITVLVNGEIHRVTTYRGEYRNLMILLYDKFYLEDFGECKGVGRCGTCHINVLNPASAAMLGKAGNETTTLLRTGVANANSRLACQIMIDENLNGLRVEVV